MDSYELKELLLETINGTRMKLLVRDKLVEQFMEYEQAMVDEQTKGLDGKVVLEVDGDRELALFKAVIHLIDEFSADEMKRAAKYISARMLDEARVRRSPFGAEGND